MAMRWVQGSEIAFYDVWWAEKFIGIGASVLFNNALPFLCHQEVDRFMGALVFAGFSAEVLLDHPGSFLPMSFDNPAAIAALEFRQQADRFRRMGLDPGDIEQRNERHHEGI